MAAKSKKSTPPPATAPASADTSAAVSLNNPALEIWSKPWIPELLLVLVATLVYAGSISNGFVFFDDDKAILYNKVLEHPSFSGFFTGQNLGMYAPMTWIAYWIGNVISGKEAWGYHLLGYLLHALNGVLAFWSLHRLTGRSWPAFFAAMLFVAHPFQVEAVSWAAALSTVLFSTFYLGALLTYIQWAKGASQMRYYLSLALFLLACLSKSAAVTLPLVLLAIDFYLNKNLIGKHWLSKIPYLLLSIGFGLYTFSTRAQEGHDIEAASSVFSVVDRFFMVSQTILFYPFKLLIPIGFSVSYPFVKMGGSWSWEYYAAPVALIALGWLVWSRLRREYDYLLAIALYLLPLTVMLPFRTVGTFELRSDRYVYLSSLGIFLIIGFLLEKTASHLKLAVLGGAAAVLGILAMQQTEVWSDGVKLFENCVNHTPESGLCQCNLAYNQLISGNYEGSAKHYSEALEYDPNTVEAYNGRGQAYLQLRKVPEALEDFNKAIEAGIVTPKLFLNRGKCLVMMGKSAEALPDLNRSLELESKAPEAYFFRAICYEKAGDFAKALADYDAAIRYNNEYVEALVNRGLILFNSNRFDEAISDYTAALTFGPENVHPLVLNNRAFAYLRKNMPDRALVDADKAIQLNANYAKAYETRAQIRMALGQNAQAQEDLAKVAALKNGK